MLTSNEYFWSSLVFLFFFGAILYVVDRSVGVAIRRVFWNLIHDKSQQLPEDKEQGFIYRRHARSRFNVALVIMVIEAFVGIAVFRGNPFTKLLTAVFDIPVLMVGFYCGPWLDRILGHVDQGLDQIENLERRIDRGETTFGKEVKSAAAGVGARVRENIYPEPPDSTRRGDSQAPQASAAAEGRAEPDPKEALRGFSREGD